MADVVASEVTRISDSRISDGYDLVVLEYYIEHTFATNDAISAASLGVKYIMSILSAQRVDATNTQQVFALHDLNGLLLQAGSRVNVAADAAGATASSVTDNEIQCGSVVDTDVGMWLTILAKVA